MILIGRHARIRGTLRIQRPAEIAALQVELAQVLRENAALRVEVAELRQTLECVRIYITKEHTVLRDTLVAMIDAARVNKAPR